MLLERQRRGVPLRPDAKVPALVLRALLALLIVAPLPTALGLTNGLALTPPMGWNSWNKYHCNVSETIIRNISGAMVTSGLQAAGYQFVNIDDCWQASRDTSGVIVADTSKFPNGIRALADYVHADGLKLGVYSDHGTNTCQHKPGSYGYEYLDANTYAAWGVDYLKFDNCNLPAGDIPQADYARMSDALMRSGRPITFSLCFWTFDSWEPDLGNLWRTTGDINDTWARMISRIDQNAPSAFLAGPGRWNDPDMLEVGNGGMTDTEYRTHFSMWCIVAAPLIAGNDLTAMSAQTLATLTNPEVIAVDQDPAGEQGIRVGGVVGSPLTYEVWCKPLGTDFSTKAVALLNRDTNAANITATWTDLGLRPGPASIRDLWAHADLGTFTDSFTTNVPGHGVVLLRVAGTPPALPAVGTTYLSDLQPAYAYVGWGAMTKDKSISGNTLTLNGTAYGKGLGVHAFSGTEYFLGAIASRFQADIGVDDEVGANGSVVFQVYADGMRIHDSGVLHGGDAHQSLDLDVRGVTRLTLGVHDADNGNSYDHADWAGARVTVSNTTPALPAAPTGLAASAGVPVGLSWNATRSAINYHVKRSGSSNGTYTNVATVPTPGYADSNVVAGAVYFYVVSAHGAVGESSNSTPVGVTACTWPAGPSGLTATINSNGVTLSWNTVAGASGYSLARSTASTPFSLVASGLVAPNYTDTNVVSCTTYYYVVAASNACNLGAYSAFVPAIIPSPASGLVTWDGGSAVGSFWTDTNNWNGATVAPGSDLVFAGSSRLNNTNDLSAGAACSTITFAAGAGAFTLNGNPLTLAESILNNSSNPQTVALGLNFSNSLSLNGDSGLLVIRGGLTNTFGAPGATTLTLAGAGTLANLLRSTTSPGGTNILLLNSASASWTLVDNASSTAATVPWIISVNSGTFAFGTASSAPVLTTTTVNNTPQDNQVGAIAGALGTLTISNGTLTTGARLNTATAANSTGIVNQVSGTLSVGSQFQGANGSNAGEVSIVNVSGGTMNIGGGSGPFYVASRGTGTLTLRGSGVVNCGKLDISRNAAGNSISSAGTVNLDGGTLMVTSVTNISANQQTGGSPAATFNFNGGTLLAKVGAAAGFFQGSTLSPVTPITTIVKAGGAFINDSGNAIMILEPLQHDGFLGSTPDGGLTKLGTGRLTLTANSTYSGATTVSAGTLALSGSASISNSVAITVAAGAGLDVSGLTGQTLTLNSGQTLGGFGTITGTVVVPAGATISPGSAANRGLLTLTGNLTLNGTTSMKLDLASQANDVLVVRGVLNYGGTLVLMNPGRPFTNGDSFSLFSAGTYSGSFGAFSPAYPGPGLAWDTSGPMTAGTLRVVPGAKIGSIALADTGVVVNGSAGSPNRTYYVLASSNVSLPVSQWIRLATNYFDASGDFMFTEPIDLAGSARFYRIQLP